MIMECLAYANTAYSTFQKYWKYTKHNVVEYLGPLPQNLYLLQDGRVIPDSIEIPEQEKASAYIYLCETHTICKATNTTPEGRFRPLPFLSIVFQNDYTERTDISEWLGDIRANPVPETIQVKQLLALWSLTTNTFVPQGNGMVVNVTDSDGNDSVLHV
jgi:hypothetical protein